MSEPATLNDWRVECGDCLDLLRALPSGSVDAVITDPPYGIAGVWKGGGGSGWNKARQQTEARNAWDGSPPPDEVLDELARLDCPMIIWGGNHFRRLPASRGWLVWNKPERNFTLSEAELAWTNIDTVVRVFDHHRSDQGRTHPTQKPVALMRWCIERAGVPVGGTVLDCYAGSCSTGVACLQTGRKFIGFEIDPEYCNIARRRMSEVAPLFAGVGGAA